MIIDEYDKNGLVEDENIFEFYKVNFNIDVSIDILFTVGAIIEDGRVVPRIKYQILSSVKYSELQDLSIAEKENKIRILDK